MNSNSIKRSKRKIEIELDYDLYNYIAFLEKIKRINKKEDALIASIRIFKKLNMQDWFPNVYRIGQERVVLLSQGMINDFFSTLSESNLSKLARLVAMNRISLDTFDHRLNLNDQTNWGVILNEVENFGWGKFIRKRNRIIISQLALPIIFVKSYLEALFKTKFELVVDDEKQTFLLKKNI